MLRTVADATALAHGRVAQHGSVRDVAITNVPFITKNRHFYRLKNFAPLRLCARKLFIGIEWIGSMVLSCQRCRGVKIASRKVAKSQSRKVAKEELMVDGYALDP